jgi:hypothetical protein
VHLVGFITRKLISVVSFFVDVTFYNLHSHVLRFYIIDLNTIFYGINKKINILYINISYNILLYCQHVKHKILRIYIKQPV